MKRDLTTDVTHSQKAVKRILWAIYVRRFGNLDEVDKFMARGWGLITWTQIEIEYLNSLIAAISVDPRDGQETLRLLLPPPRSLCASTGHSPHRPSRQPVQPATARVPGSRDNFPGRTQGTPQAGATSRRPRPPQARPASSIPLPPPGLSEPEPPKQLLL